LEETNKIMKAQQARGADFESGGPIKRAKALIPILVPLFVSSFRRAGELAEAMEARCYHGGEGRTRMKPLRYRAADHLFLGITVLYFVLIILL
jgi:energy-coupling factor transport system permease protein